MEQFGIGHRILQASSPAMMPELLIRQTTSNMGWFITDDQVMGGRSQSYFAKKGDYNIFYGNLNTNGGGFCTLNTKKFEKPLDLEKYKGLALDVRSQTNLTYKIGFKERNDGWYERLFGKSVNWSAKFEVPASPKGSTEWTTIEVPFSEFIPTSFG